MTTDNKTPDPTPALLSAARLAEIRDAAIAEVLDAHKRCRQDLPPEHWRNCIAGWFDSHEPTREDFAAIMRWALAGIVACETNGGAR